MTGQSGFHEDFSREDKIQGSSDRGFGLVFAAFFALLGALALWHAKPHWYWWIGAAVATLLVALTLPRALAPFNWVWTRLGLVIFKVISPLALAVIYFGTMMPMSILLRLRNKDILRRKYDPQAATYWIPREPPGPDPQSMKNQF
jgi:hypothetical protein